MNLGRVIEVFDRKEKQWVRTSFNLLADHDIFRIFDNDMRYIDPDDNSVFIANSEPYIDEENEWRIETLF